MSTIFMMSAKMVTPGLPKIKLCFKKVHDFIICIYDVSNNFFSGDSDYIVDVVMWPKFGNSSIYIRKVIKPTFYKDLTRKITFFEWWSWFRFNNLALNTNLKFYIIVAKGLKLSQNGVGVNSYFVEVTREKLVGRIFLPTLPLHPELG